MQGDELRPSSGAGWSETFATGMAPSTEEADATTLRLVGRSRDVARADAGPAVAQASARAASGAAARGRSHEPIMSAMNGLSQSRIAGDGAGMRSSERLFGALAAVGGIAGGLVVGRGQLLACGSCATAGGGGRDGDDERERPGRASGG